MNENSIAQIVNSMSILVGLLKNLKAIQALERAIAGILIINDIIIASLLLKPKKRAPVMEAPDLLVPGNTAADCQIPISKAVIFGRRPKLDTSKEIIKNIVLIK